MDYLKYKTDTDEIVVSIDSTHKNAYLSISDMEKVFNSIGKIDLKYDINRLKTENIINENSTTKNKDGETLYNLNVVFSIGLNNFVNATKKLYLFVKENKLDNTLYTFIKDAIENLFLPNEKDPLYVIDSYQDVFSHYAKNRIKEENDNYHYAYSYPYIIIELYQQIIEDAKIRYNFPDDFGVEKEPGSLEKILDVYSNVDFGFEKNPVEDQLARYFYSIVTEKPFVNYNNEIATILLLYFLDNINYIIKEDVRNLFNSSDIVGMITLIENSSSEQKEEVIEKIKKMLIISPYNYYKKVDKAFAILKENNTYNNVVNYIVAFIENYYGYQGYYEFYKYRESSVLKIHYHGEYNKFKLNIADSIQNYNTLVFDVYATAYMEAPIGLVHRDEIIEELYKEIKARSYDDIIKDKLMKALRLKLVPYFCLKDINIEFNFIWTLEADEEYEY